MALKETKSEILIVDRLAHLTNGYEEDNPVTPVPILTRVRDVQSENAKLPIVPLLLRVTSVTLLHPENASVPMLVIPSSTTTTITTLTT